MCCDQKFMTAREVADNYFSGIYSYSIVLKMTRDGSLPAVKQGKKYLYRKENLDKWFEDKLKNKQSKEK